MPRGRPKRPVLIRLEQDLIDEVKRRGENLTAAIEAGLAMWLIVMRQADAAAKRKPAPEEAGT